MKTSLTTRTNLIRIMLLEAATGNATAIRGFVDYLLYDLHLEPSRIVAIAKRRFHLPEDVTYSLLVVHS